MSHAQPARTVSVLAVEDDDAAYHLLKLAFEEVNRSLMLKRVVDDRQAMEFLCKLPPFERAERPDLILLNLNLPKMSGLEVLAAIRRDSSLNQIPVVVFTSSALDEDRAHCLALGAREFVTKPVDFDELVSAVKNAHAFISL